MHVFAVFFKDQSFLALQFDFMIAKKDGLSGPFADEVILCGKTQRDQGEREGK